MQFHLFIWNFVQKKDEIVSADCKKEEFDYPTFGWFRYHFCTM